MLANSVITFTLFLSCVTFSNAAQIVYKQSRNFATVNQRHIFLNGTDISVDNSPHLIVPVKLHIVSGVTASRGQFCYAAYLQFSDGKNYWSCGGSLVTPTTVITAAHCAQGATWALVVLGAHNLGQGETGRQVVYVPKSGLKVHKEYDATNIYNDIALITMPRAVTITQYICTVNLPACSSGGGTSAAEDNLYTVCGWGKTSDRTYTRLLTYVDVSGEAHSSCASFYKQKASYTVIDSQLCTSGSNSKSTCNGDSGGPLVMYNSSGSPVLQGIVSLGLSSCQLSAPSVYTDVSSFASWICSNLG